MHSVCNGLMMGKSGRSQNATHLIVSLQRKACELSGALENDVQRNAKAEESFDDH